MAMPRKLKHMNLFLDGISYLGQVDEVVLPKLTRQMEDYRAGGMNAPIKVDHGMEALSMEYTLGGISLDVLKTFGTATHDGVLARFAGSYQREDTGTISAVEVTTRGRHSELDMATAKTGDNTAHKAVIELSYYRLTVDNEDIIEIDIINMIEKVNGVDLLADHRKAIGV
jgi:P2 family phage contractile tail tube protein